MKTITVTMAMLGLFFSVITASCIQGPIVKGSKNYITKKVAVDNFQGIRLQGSADITYRQSPNTEVEIYGSDNILPLLEIFTDKGVLIIRYKKGTRITNPGKLEIKVSSPDLNGLSINGSGDVNLANGIKTEKDIKLEINGSGDINGSSFQCQSLHISINGSGDIKLKNIQSQSCAARISGSGDIALSGQTTQAEFSISGSGDISADQLKAEQVSASTSGSGDISCYASKKLTARITGSGDIGYKGNPLQIDAPLKKIHAIK